MKLSKHRFRRKAENLHLILKFVILGGSGYLLWKRFQQEQANAAAAKVQGALATASGQSAMQPLVAATTQALPLSEPQVLRTTITPEKVETAQALTTPQDVVLQGASAAFQGMLAKLT